METSADGAWLGAGSVGVHVPGLAVTDRGGPTALLEAHTGLIFLATSEHGRWKGCRRPKQNKVIYSAGEGR